MTDVDALIRRVVNGMKESISAFEADRLSIDRLVWELKSRIAALQEVADPEWVEELRAMRNQLEVVNAFFIESGRKTLTSEERREVNDILGELKSALVTY